MVMKSLCCGEPLVKKGCPDCNLYCSKCGQKAQSQATVKADVKL